MLCALTAAFSDCMYFLCSLLGQHHRTNSSVQLDSTSNRKGGQDTNNISPYTTYIQSVHVYIHIQYVRVCTYVYVTAVLVYM